jgi:heme o synthase
VILVALTLLPAIHGVLGPWYLAVAIAAGGVLLWQLFQLWRRGDPAAEAWRIYRYSLLYLAIIFTAMAADRVLTRLL